MQSFVLIRSLQDRTPGRRARVGIRWLRACVCVRAGHFSARGDLPGRGFVGVLCRLGPRPEGYSTTPSFVESCSRHPIDLRAASGTCKLGGRIAAARGVYNSRFLPYLFSKLRILHGN